MSNRSEKYGSHSEISQYAKTGAQKMLELAAKRRFTRKVLSIDTGIPATTLKYWEETGSVPLDGFVAIASVKGFPNELLSLPFEAASKAIADDEPEDHDVDDLARAAIEVLSKYVSARHPDSAGGIRIVHSEIPEIQQSARALKAAAKKVAA